MRYFPLALLALTACASTQTVLDKEPSSIHQSDKSVSRIAFCIANKNNTQSMDGPDGGKIVQVKNSIGAVGVLYEILPSGKGSTVNVKRANSPISYTRFKTCL